MTELQERLDLALSLAREAGEYVLGYYQRLDLSVDSKADASPVTIADKGGEELIRSRLANQCPRDGVLGEEFPETEGGSGWRWILDPIDGTQSFIRGVPLFGTMVALEHEGDAVAGVIVFPALRESIYAATECGAWWTLGLGRASEPIPEVRRAQVSDVAELARATFTVTSSQIFDQMGMADAYVRMSRAVGRVRGWGDCFGHYLVATGRVDVMVDPEVKPWDNAPLKPIMEEAGGCFTDLSGAPTIYGGSGISTNGLLHEAALRVLGRPD